MVAHLGFIPAEEAFAGIADVDAPLTAGLPDKLQHRTELFVGRAQRRVVLGTAHGEDREEPPVFQALGDEHPAKSPSLGTIAPVTQVTTSQASDGSRTIMRRAPSARS